MRIFIIDFHECDKMRVNSIINKLCLFLFYCKKKWLLQGSMVICERGGARLSIGRNAQLRHCKIHVYAGGSLYIGNDTVIERAQIRVFPGSEVTIGESCHISDTLMFITGKLRMGNHNVCEKGYYYQPMKFDVEGNVFMGDYNRLRCVIWTRFNSTVRMGNYNNVNEESEIRCDDKINIGDFNQISYRCTIWDTNTHNIYGVTQRRNLTIEKFPACGYEYERPKTIPVQIGDDNWIGRGVTLLKGTIIGNRCIVGYGTILCKVHVPDNNTVIQSIELKMLPNGI